VTITDTRCRLTELLVDQCAHCRQLPDPPPRRTGRPFRSAYTGHCWDCGEPYAVDDRIRRVSDDAGIGYLGPCCGNGDDHA
jgi:hypothetical protein